MRRKIDTFLDRWASAQDAGPLLVRGARRVGKTYCIKRLGTDVFGTENFAYCDFQTNLSQLNDVLLSALCPTCLFFCEKTLPHAAPL